LAKELWKQHHFLFAIDGQIIFHFVLKRTLSVDKRSNKFLVVIYNLQWTDNFLVAAVNMG
jgi:hypothetical protein